MGSPSSAVAEAAYDLEGSLSEWAAGVVDAYGTLTRARWGAVWSLYSTDQWPPESLHFQVHEGSAALQPACKFAERLAGKRLSAALVAGGLHDMPAMVPGMSRIAQSFRLPMAATGITAPDRSGRGLFIGFPHPRDALVQRAKDVAAATVPHVAAGLRLRRALAAPGGPDRAEAVLDPSGRVVDATGPARELDARTRLREVALRRDAARSGSRASDEESESLWEPLVQGRWSLVDRIESDGRRYIVACANPEGVLDPRKLTPVEQDVARLSALGMSYKEIAAELGIKEGSVGPALHSATRKLGLEKPLHLPLFFRDAQARVRPICLESGDVRLRVAGGAPAMPVDARLTPAEDQVLSLLLEGHSNAFIASARGASKKTIANQIYALFRKLGVRSRQELVANIASDGRDDAGAP